MKSKRKKQMPYTTRQRKAACAELARRKAGKKAKIFKSMSMAKLKEWCGAKKLEKKKRKARKKK